MEVRKQITGELVGDVVVHFPYRGYTISVNWQETRVWWGDYKSDEPMHPQAFAPSACGIADAVNYIDEMEANSQR